MSSSAALITSDFMVSEVRLDEIGQCDTKWVECTDRKFIDNESDAWDNLRKGTFVIQLLQTKSCRIDFMAVSLVNAYGSSRERTVHL